MDSIVLLIVPILVAIAIALVVFASDKFATLPALAKVKADYPVINLVLKLASEQLKDTQYGLLFDAAYQLWEGRGYTPEQAKKYAQAIVKHFDVEKYVGTDWDALTPEQLKIGQDIAAKLLPRA